MNIFKLDFESKEIVKAIEVLRDSSTQSFGNLTWQYNSSSQGHEGVVVSAYVLDEPAKQIAVLATNHDRSWTKATTAQGWEVPVKTLIEHLDHSGK